MRVNFIFSLKKRFNTTDLLLGIYLHLFREVVYEVVTLMTCLQKYQNKQALLEFGMAPSSR